VIGLDTNVLVRYVAQDDPSQSSTASALIEGLAEDNPGFVSLVVIAEVTWVLRRVYGVGDPVIATVLLSLLDATEVIVQEHDAVRRALNRTNASTEFTDALIAELGHRAGCTHTVTFDLNASRLPHMMLLST
jgi:predicted nucleic-acid-binding protein